MKVYWIHAHRAFITSGVAVTKIFNFSTTMRMQQRTDSKDRSAYFEMVLTNQDNNKYQLSMLEAVEAAEEEEEDEE